MESTVKPVLTGKEMTESSGVTTPTFQTVQIGQFIVQVSI